MERVAVFVDAGYLFAQGSTNLTGSKKARIDLVFNARTAVEQLRAFAVQKAPHCSLLRIYWYDGAVSGAQPTSEQSQIAGLDDVKLRLGFINSAGQQKGVDSLIVTDLIELARQKAICDAILLSGDEDVRVGVQIAQNYGVRLHLLGIAPARGSQSYQLMQEADTTSVWDKDMVSTFLAMRAPSAAPSPPSAVATPAPVEPEGKSKQVGKCEPAVAVVVEAMVASLEQADIKAIEVFWQSNRGVPSDFDRKMLAQARDAIGRDLGLPEKGHMRAYFRQRVLERITAT
ncbi:MAG: NYN domain-containing protein [Devosia sp.]|nr:NYN domain-containing protein [Devosia sp.]